MGVNLDTQNLSYHIVRCAQTSEFCMGREGNVVIFREGVKKKIESVIMIIPCRTTPPSFLRTVIGLGFFFRDVFFINPVSQVCLKTHFGYV